MRAAVVSTPGTISIESLPDPTPEPGEIVVGPRAVGICGTDLHVIDGHFPPAPYPLVPGHEFAGEVLAVGGDVGHVAVGDRVAVDPSLFCGHCVYCQRRRGNLCVNWGATGDTVNGAFAQFVSVPARDAYAIPDDMGWGRRRAHRTAGMRGPWSASAVNAGRIRPARDGRRHYRSATAAGCSSKWRIPAKCDRPRPGPAGTHDRYGRGRDSGLAR